MDGSLSPLVYLQSIYLNSFDYQKKKAAKTLLMHNAPAHTFKTQVGQPSNDTISNDFDSVNTQNTENKYSSRGMRWAFAEKTLKSFGITKLNDSIHVQRQVLSTLEMEGFFTDVQNRSRTDVNEESGMIIETNKSGIEETFCYNNFIRLGMFKKIAKLVTIRDLPRLIKNGRIVADDVSNKYDKNDKNKKFAYIESETTVDGEKVIVKLAIKKSPQKNKFWVHSIYTIENASNNTESLKNDAVTDITIADVE